MSITAAIAFASLAAWLYLFFGRGNFWKVANSDDDHYPDPSAWPSVSVVIPARNEADVLAFTLPGLLNQDYPDLHIVLVDDNSEDGTAAVAVNTAKQNNASDRLTVVQASRTPTEWKGKPWAMQCGFKQVEALGHAPRYLLLTDADILYSKESLKQLVAKAEAENLALTSLMVRLHCTSRAEKLLIPAFVFFFQMLYPFSWVRKGKCAAAAGGCMLARYGALQRIGGLETIRSALIDDCALARQMQKQGRLSLGLTKNVESLRLYPHLRDIHAMVARTAYDQLGYSPFGLTGTVLGMTLVFLTPVALALFASGTPQFCGITGWILMSMAFLPMLRFYRCLPGLSPLLPLISFIYMIFTLDSARQYYQGRGGMWKGRAQACGTAA